MSDTWVLGAGSGPDVENPGWSQIQQSIERMNGIDLNEVMLEMPGTGSLVAGGGDEGRYIVVYLPDDPERRSLTLSDPSLTGPDVQLTAQTPTSYPARWCVALPLVLKAFRHFHTTGELPRDIRWEIDTTGEAAEL
jgi:hypothetical protein